MVEAEEGIERKGGRTNEAQLQEQVELTGIFLSYKITLQSKVTRTVAP